MKKLLFVSALSLLSTGLIYSAVEKTSEKLTLKVGQNWSVINFVERSGMATAGGDTGRWTIKSNKPEGIIKIEDVTFTDDDLTKQRLTFTALKEGSATIILSNFRETGSHEKTIKFTVEPAVKNQAASIDDFIPVGASLSVNFSDFNRAKNPTAYDMGTQWQLKSIDKPDVVSFAAFNGISDVYTYDFKMLKPGQATITFTPKIENDAYKGKNPAFTFTASVVANRAN